MSEESGTTGVTLEDMKLYWDLHELRVTLSLHYRNYEELLNYSVMLEDIELWSAERFGELKEALLETIRMLHNFLASAKTLIDHTRRHMKRFHSQDAQESYAKRVADLNHDGLRSFVQDLRNYMLHTTAATLTARISATPSGPHAGAVLPVKEILTWNRWTAAARGYIDTAEAEIVVRKAIDEYMRRITEVYEWLRKLELSTFANTLKRLGLEIEPVLQVALEGGPRDAHTRNLLQRTPILSP